MQGVTDNQVWVQYIMSLGAHGATSSDQGAALADTSLRAGLFARANSAGAPLGFARSCSGVLAH